MNYGYAALKDAELIEMTPKEYPTQFPFRTDYGNETLPWYQLKDGVVPPRYSEHLVLGELMKVNSDEKGGQFKTDRTGELVDFTLLPQGSVVYVNDGKSNRHGLASFQSTNESVRYLDAQAALSDLPFGGRYRFHLYQDEKGTFTKASLVSDEFSHLALNSVSYRIELIKLDEGKLYAAVQIPQVKNYNGDMERPPDIGRAELRVNPDTRVWKGGGKAKLSELAVGDELRVNVTSEQPGAPSHCTDIWVGADAFEAATAQQEKKHSAVKK
jgi:hypothetical protein